MKKTIKYKNDYSTILERFELPLVYNYSVEHKPEDSKSLIKYIPSDFYQTNASIAEYPYKPVCKIIYE